MTEPIIWVYDDYNCTLPTPSWNEIGIIGALSTYCGKLAIRSWYKLMILEPYDGD